MEFKNKTDSQSVEDWLEQLMEDCLELHMMAKEVGSLPDSDREKLVTWFLECSDEPEDEEPIRRVLSRILIEENNNYQGNFFNR